MRSGHWAAVVLLLATGCGGDAEPGAGDWEFKVDSARGTAWLRLVGRTRATEQTPSRQVVLTFDCLPDREVVAILTDQALRQGSMEAELTLDSAPPLVLPGFAGTTPTGGQVVLTVPQDSLLAALSGRSRAVIEYVDGAGSSRTTAEFPLAGLEVYRDRFRAACAGRKG